MPKAKYTWLTITDLAQDFGLSISQMRDALVSIGLMEHSVSSVSYDGKIKKVWEPTIKANQSYIVRKKPGTKSSGRSKTVVWNLEWVRDRLD
jgi:hypothetical protein